MCVGGWSVGWSVYVTHNWDELVKMETSHIFFCFSLLFLVPYLALVWNGFICYSFSLSLMQKHRLSELVTDKCTYYVIKCLFMVRGMPLIN